ncbi:pectinesterase family protein [Kineococcus esterisolvens]|uniref:pectinesterase family protein n=1 Tax=unclassified Kineococcus TaxID=2621656 RepID=UPI003D7DF316
MSSPSGTPRAFTARACAFRAVPPFVALALAAGLATPAAAAAAGTGAVQVERAERGVSDAVTSGTWTPAPSSTSTATPAPTPSPATGGTGGTGTGAATGTAPAPTTGTGTPTADTTAPAAVRSLKAKGSTSSVKLSWSKGSEKDLAGYRVYRASASGEFQLLATTTSPKFTDKGAPAGFTSHYRVSAVDRAGNESAPVTASALRRDKTAPGTPSGLVATAGGDGIALDWADGADGDLAGYVVQRATGTSRSFKALTGTPVTASAWNDTTAVPGTAYTYRVTAVDHSGNDSRAATTGAVLPDDVAPAVVRSLKAKGSSSGVTLSWSKNREKDLVGYRVYRSATADGEFELVGTPTSAKFSDKTAPEGVFSHYRVTAVDLSGNESAAATATGLREDRTAPAAPTAVVATPDLAAATVALDWADGAEPDVATWVVQRSTGTKNSFKTLAKALTASQFTDTTAVAGTAYTYRVAAVDLSGNTGAYTTVGATLPDTAAPSAVRSLAAKSTSGGVSLSWPKGSEKDLAGYRVYRAATADSEFALVTTTTSAKFTDTTAPTGVFSHYRVTAVDRSGNESLPASASVLRTDRVAPAAPAGLTATAGEGGVALTWTASTEPDLAGYVVQRATGTSTTFDTLTTTALTTAAFTDTTAVPGTAYTYRVRASDLSGNLSEPGAGVGALRPDVTAPAAPTGLGATGTETGNVLTWTASTEPDLAGYLVFRSVTPDAADGSWTQLTGTPLTEPAFTDTTAPEGATSSYRVVATDTSGNTSAPAAAQVSRPAAAPVVAADVTVAADGSRDFTTVTAALAAAPAGTTPFVIAIEPGTYRETFTLTRSNTTLVGTTGNAADVVISYDNAAGTAKPDGSGTYGTTGSATVTVKGSDVTAKNLTIENSYVETGSGSEQAVALKTVGDRLVFDNVRLLGDQDTLYADSPRAGALARSYFVNSYVEGDVDFVFGRGTAVFDRSTLHASTRGSTSNNGYLTAASTDESLPYGYLITDSRITSDAPAGTFHLGRPWQPSGDVNAVAQVVIRDTELPAAIKSSPWTDMSATFSWRDARFAEYRNTGVGATVSADRPQLSDLDAAKHTKFTYLAGADGWNPTGEAAPADTTAPAAVDALGAEPSDSSVTLTWTAGTDTDLAGYAVYRSTAEVVELTAANRIATGVTGTSYTDRTAANGTTYRYVVTAVDSSSNESPASAPVTAAPVGVPLPAHDVLVAADGTGQYTSVADAIAAAPAGTAANPTVIAVKPGVYREMITISRSGVTLIGTTGTATDVVLTYDNAAGTPIPGGTGTYGTGKSQSVLVSGNDVTVRDLTIENSFDEAASTYDGEQAVALKTTGDRLVFDNVRLLGNQDTLLVDSPDATKVARSYFVDSYVEGDVDFIFGRGTAVFDRTTIHALSRGSSSNNGYITAASTADTNPYGFLITDSRITSDAPANSFHLGRPWRGWSDDYTKNGVEYPDSRGQVTIRETALPEAVKSSPWTGMSPNLWTDGRFFEYRNTGAGAAVNDDRPQLTDEQAASATKWAYLAGSDGWNPTGQAAPGTTAPVTPTTPVETVAPAAPSALSSRLSGRTVVLDWTAPADADVAGYTVQRSTGDGAAVQVATGVTVTTFTDTTATPGTAYRYTVTAVDTSGNVSPAAAPVTATPVAADVVVAADGSGDATTLQAGIDLLKNNSDFAAQGGATVLVQPGTYTGAVTSGNRYGITILGAGARPEDTVITAAAPGATLVIAGRDWTVKNLTVASTGTSSALQTQGDRNVFEDVRFLGDKQTLKISSPNTSTQARAYFHRVFVEGGADTLIGRGTAVFADSTFHLLDRPGSAMTDSSIDGAFEHGFLITGSRILTDGAANSAYLGRPYPETPTAVAQVVVRETEIGSAVSTSPWKDWNAATPWTGARFLEHRNTGAGAAVTDPATRPQLSDEEAERYTVSAYLAGADGWNPAAG